MTDAPRLLDALPTPLLEEFKAGRWLPIVGAGLSMGARDCGPDGMPDWERLGGIIGSDLPAGYSQGGAVEAISAYEHAYGRMRLTTRVMRALHMGRATPSPAQLRFAALSFEHVVTTNVEQLLEDAYRRVRGPVFTVVEDGQLRMVNPYDSPTLVKLHGDVHNPSTLVLSENDYDNVHLTRPLMLTWLAGQLITKTGILIGYSLADPDVRSMLASLRTGLGSVPPDLWVLTIDSDPVIVERYRRRGVRVATLPRTADGWGILATLFEELLELSRSSSAENMTGTTSAVDAAMKAGRSVDAFVLFLIPADRLPMYADFVFPQVVDAGLVPVSRNDVRANQGFTVAATDSLLRVAGSVVVETAAPDDANIFRALTAVGKDRTVVLAAHAGQSTAAGLLPPADKDSDEWLMFGEALVAALLAQRDASRDTARDSIVVEAADDLRTRTLVTLIDLEAALRGLELEGTGAADRHGAKFQPLQRLLLNAVEEGFFPGLGQREIDLLVQVRNALVHGGRDSLVVEPLRDALRIASDLLQQVQTFLVDRADGDVGTLLEQYATEAPHNPHRQLFQALAELGYVPHAAPSPRSYIRWVLTGAKGRVTLYQVVDGLLIDSRVHRPFAEALPGAHVQGRRVSFNYDNGFEVLQGAAQAIGDRVVGD